MKKMSVNNIKERNTCERKGFFDSLGLESKKGRHYHLAVAAKKAIAEERADIEFLESMLPDGLFLLEEMKVQSLKVLSFKIERYLEHLKSLNIIGRKRIVDVKIDNIEIPVTIDLIVDRGMYIESIMVKTGKTNLSYQARIDENMPENNVELYFLQKAGESLPKSITKGRPVVASIHYLTSKNETQKELDEKFNIKKGNNIISCNRFSERLIGDIKKLVNYEPEQIEAAECSACEKCNYNSICSLELNKEIELEEVEEMQDKAGKGFAVTESQQRVIDFKKGIARINAGAGSGKTTVISLRVVDLVESGCNPEDILLITFTNKGAQEMREKIAFWIDKKGLDIDVSRFNIMTFNSWGADLLSKHFSLLGYENEPVLVEIVESYDMIIEIFDDYTKKLESFDYRNPLFSSRHSQGVIVGLAKAFNFIKGHDIKSAAEYRKTESYMITGRIDGKEYINPLTKETHIYKGEDDFDRVYELYELYTKALKEKEYIEYQDQVNQALEIIKKYPEEMNLNYKHLIIDEMQDSDHQQLEIIKYLTNRESFESLIVVGDDLQSIFGFKNTSQEIILNFDKYFDGVVDINITENFRSTKAILGLANAVANLNEYKLEKDLISKGANGVAPELIVFENKSNEIPEIANMIKKDFEDGKKLEEIAFIGRTKAEITKLKELLDGFGVPNVMDVPKPFINNPNLKIAQSLSEYFNDLNLSAELFNYIYAVEKDQVTGLNREALIKYIDERHNTIVNYLYDGGNFTPITETGEIDKSFKRDLNERKLIIFFDMLSIIEDEELTKFMEEMQERFNNMGSLNYYLNKILVYEDPRSIELDEVKYKAVTLTTAHSSKGREWDKTYISVSKFNDPKDQAELEEERRLVFVALTRAKKELIVTSNKYRHKKTEWKNRFAEEIAETGLAITSEVA